MKININPVYYKELKISARSIKTALILLSFNTVLALIGLVSFYLTFNYGYFNRVQYIGILQIYLYLVIIEFGLVLFVVPAFTSSAISGEREKQTLEILLTTKLTPGQIVWGKLMSSISLILLLIVSSLPILALVFTIGGIHLIDLIQFMFFCLTTAIFVGSIGIFYSTMFKKTVPSTIFTYGSIILIILGTLAVVCAVYLMGVQAYDKVYYAKETMETYNPPGVGNLVLIFLINPAVTLFSLVSRQFGSPTYLAEYLGIYGKTSDFIFQHWFLISVLLQMLLSFLFLRLSIRRLNPVKYKKRRGKK